RQILVSGGPGHTELLEAGLEPLGRDADGDGPREVERRVRLLFRHHGVAALGQPRQRRLAHARGDEHVAALRVQPWRLDRLLQRAAPVHEVGDDLRYARAERAAAARPAGAAAPGADIVRGRARVLARDEPFPGRLHDGGVSEVLEAVAECALDGAGAQVQTLHARPATFAEGNSARMFSVSS